MGSIKGGKFVISNHSLVLAGRSKSAPYAFEFNIANLVRYNRLNIKKYQDLLTLHYTRFTRTLFWNTYQSVSYIHCYFITY